VYGEQSRQPLSEAMIPHPDSPYAVSKLAAEYYVRTIGTLWGIETVSLRVFNAYGPNQPMPASHPPVVPRFLKSALTHGSLVIHGDGSQTRDYVYVADVVNALVTAATAGAVDQLVINVGSGTEVSVQDLIREVSAVLGQTIEPIIRTAESGGVQQMCADLTLASKKLAYKPSVSLAEGLRRTVDSGQSFQ